MFVSLDYLIPIRFILGDVGISKFFNPHLTLLGFFFFSVIQAKKKKKRRNFTWDIREICQTKKSLYLL